jgi:hypothetical protein
VTQYAFLPLLLLATVVLKFAAATQLHTQIAAKPVDACKADTYVMWDALASKGAVQVLESSS